MRRLLAVAAAGVAAVAVGTTRGGDTFPLTVGAYCVSQHEAFDERYPGYSERSPEERCSDAVLGDHEAVDELVAEAEEVMRARRAAR